MLAEKTKKITILGATGSIGMATIDIVRDQLAQNADPVVSVQGLTAHTKWRELAALALELKPAFVGLSDERHLEDLRNALAGTGIEIAGGKASLLHAASLEADWIMAAITGAAGLPPILEAAKQGGTLAIANKESLICAGSLLGKVCADAGTTILPVDSEHNAIFQVLEPSQRHMVEKIILTASGGPFRTWDAKQIALASPAQAIAHPVWSMGAKISVDSATLMNKGLELIEARHLFDASPSELEVLVHPQSIVHGLVEYKDGSMLAQLGSPDMRVPISACWDWPKRTSTSCKRLALHEVGKLEFELPDYKKFPALGLARQAMEKGGHASNALSASNEVAVEAFLNNQIPFGAISTIVEEVLLTQTDEFGTWEGEPGDFTEVFAVDELARAMAVSIVKSNISMHIVATNQPGQE